MNNLKILIKHLLTRFLKLFFILSSVVFLQTFLSALSIFSIGPIVDFLINDNNNKQSFIGDSFQVFFGYFNIEYKLSSLIIFFASLTILVSLINILIYYIILRIKYKVLQSLLNEFLKDILNTNYSFFLNIQSGKLINTFNNEISKIGDSFGSITRIFSYSVQFFVFLIIPILISIKLTVVFLISIFIMAIPIFFFRKNSYNLGKINTETANQYVTTIYETINSIKTVLINSLQIKMINRFNKSFFKHVTVTIKYQSLINAIPHLFTPISVIATLITLYYASVNNYSYAELIMIIYSFNRLAPFISQILKEKSSIDAFIPAFEQLTNIKNQSELFSENKNNKIFPDEFNNLEIKNVKFNYNDNKFNFNKINLSFSNQAITAITGLSGSGKTTITDLIIGLIKPKEGSIELNNFNLNIIDIDRYRKNIGYVSQETELFNLSIKDNFLLFYPDINDDDINQACLKANIFDFINSLPKKLDTIVGDKGTNLSGGQKQRIAIARALAGNPMMLILDEPTSALDKISEEFIINTIQKIKEDTIVIVITHSEILLKSSNKMYFIDEGSIHSVKDYEDLVKNYKFILK